MTDNLYQNLPNLPGVYIMRDVKGGVLYVGKAKNLKKRVTSYFVSRGQHSPKTRDLVKHIVSLETMVVGTETEALILENEQIKKYRPPYNVLMRDDKSYLYIRVTVQEEFSRILLTRKIMPDGAKYFGPFVESKIVYDTIRLVKKIFPLCGSTSEITKEKLKSQKPRACLNYHLGICPGVCLGLVESRDYQQTISRVIDFLNGKYETVLTDLKDKMRTLAEHKEFERAARLRDSIQSVEKINQRQTVVVTDLSANQDIIGLSRQLNQTVVCVMQVRGGKLFGQQFLVLQNKYETEDEEVLTTFLEDYYLNVPVLPKQIMIPMKIENQDQTQKLLGELAGKKIVLMVPEKGRMKQLLKLASLNAGAKFSSLASKFDLEERLKTDGIEELKSITHLEKIERIEAYDISNTQGTDSVGAMVVWEKGAMNKSQYRRFKIKTVVGPDDFASLAEVLTRRFTHDSSDEKFARLPDLLLIDGGKGQVNIVAKALKDYPVKIIGMAKGDHSAPKAKDDIVIPGAPNVVVLPNNSPAKMLLQNIRDEVHRYALGFHTQLRKKHTVKSALDSISGIGPKTKQKILKKFGSLKGAANASWEELVALVGEKKAREIQNLK